MFGQVSGLSCHALLELGRIIQCSCLDRAMKKLILLTPILLLAGCASTFNQDRPYYACYYGEHMQQNCLNTAVPEGRKLVCVDMVKPAGMPLKDCDKQVKDEKKRSSWF